MRWRHLAAAAAKASSTPLPFFLSLDWREFLRWCDALQLLDAD